MNINVGLTHIKVVQFIFNPMSDLLKYLSWKIQLKVQYWRPRSEDSSPSQAHLVPVLMLIFPNYIVTKWIPLQEGKYDFVEYTRGTISHVLKWLTLSPPLVNMLTHIYGWEQIRVFYTDDQNELVDWYGDLELD